MNPDLHQAYVYHIFDVNDPLNLTKGYIGVARDVTRRISEHLCKLKQSKHINYKLQKYFNKHKKIEYNIIDSNTVDNCYLIEKQLRPTENIGLNIICGGLSGGGEYSRKYSRGFLTPGLNRRTALERAAKGELPAQLSCKANAHHFQTKEHSIRTSINNVKRFSNTVIVTDLQGQNKRISREEFLKQQHGPRDTWEFVGIRSKEATQRRVINGT